MSKSLGQELRQEGFDLTEYDRSTKYYTPKCSQCEVSVIQGHACHETGCPNIRKVKYGSKF